MKVSLAKAGGTFIFFLLQTTAFAQGPAADSVP